MHPSFNTCQDREQCKQSLYQWLMRHLLQFDSDPLRFIYITIIHPCSSRGRRCNTTIPTSSVIEDYSNMWNTTIHPWTNGWISSEGKTVDVVDVLDYDEIDTTQHYFPNEIWGVRPPREVALKISTAIPMVLFGILGNSSLIYVIIRNRNLQTSTNLFITNMACADLGTLLLCPSILLCIDLFQNYIFGPVGCHIDGFLTHALTLVAVFSLSIVSYDRCSAIVLSCSGKLSRRAACILICITWLGGMAVAAPLAFFRNYRTRQWIDFLESYCTENPLYFATYWNIFVGVSVWAPLAIMAVSYSAILIKLDKYETIAMKSRHPIAVKYKGNVARILALVVLVFIICRVPFTVLVLQREKLLQQSAKQQQADSIHQLWYVSRYLVLLNAAVNPILYGCTSPPLRQALASCPTIAWIIRTKKINCVKRCSAYVQRSPDKCGILKPRSPCFRLHDIREPAPHITSEIATQGSSPLRF